MKKNRLLLLFFVVMLALLTACGATPATGTPTSVTPTEFVIETDTPVVEMTVTETGMPPTETETRVPTATTVGNTTATATGVVGVVPVQLVCWFCVQQVPHVLVSMPQSATFEVLLGSNVECNSVEMVNDQQLVLCQGPSQAGNVSFDLNVCSNGACSQRHLAAVDCSGTAMPVVTSTMTMTMTMTRTVTVTGMPMTATQTPTVGGGGTATSTPVVVGTSTASTTPTRATATVTPTP